MTNKIKYIIVVLGFFTFGKKSLAQPIPSKDEKFPFLITFSKEADKKWGDDDNVQTLFFVVPETNTSEVYIRVFDPNVGGKNDEPRGTFNSKTKFSVYGGSGAHSNKDAINVDPKGNYKSGTLIASKIFDSDDKYDGQWYTFGPINPKEGELQPQNGGYVLKLIIEGLEGDDGNLYNLFFSKSAAENIPVDGGNTFCYEYTLRLPEKAESICHVYPFLPANVVAAKINIFDFDDEGLLRIVTIKKKGEIKNSNSQGKWSTEIIKIDKEEQNTSMDIQFIKKKNIKNNNLVIYITNQFNEAIPFYSIPIGGIPRYKYKIEVEKK